MFAAAKLKKLGRLFVIKTRVEVYMVTYALGLGAAERGMHYLDQYPGYGGYLLMLACTGSVFMASAKMLDCVKLEREKAEAGGTVTTPAGTGSSAATNAATAIPAE